MKKILMTMMMLALMAVLVACGSKDEDATDDKTTGDTTEPKVEETETAETMVITHKYDN